MNELDDDDIIERWNKACQAGDESHKALHADPEFHQALMAALKRADEKREAARVYISADMVTESGITGIQSFSVRSDWSEALPPERPEKLIDRSKAIREPIITTTAKRCIIGGCTEMWFCDRHGIDPDDGTRKWYCSSWVSAKALLELEPCETPTWERDTERARWKCER